MHWSRSETQRSGEGSPCKLRNRGNCCFKCERAVGCLPVIHDHSDGDCALFHYKAYLTPCDALCDALRAFLLFRNAAVKVSQLWRMKGVRDVVLVLYGWLGSMYAVKLVPLAAKLINCKAGSSCVRAKDRPSTSKTRFNI